MRKICLPGIVWILAMVFCANFVLAATYSSKNFTVITSDPRHAEQLADRAESLREKLSLFWLGKTLPNWYKRCKIHIQIGNDFIPGGSTTFTFNNGEVYGWDMKIQGSLERLYDSVLPHEITHMVLASHFRVPLPRWADEGAATFTEHQSERNKYRQQLYRALKNHEGIPLDRLFEMEEYPQNPLPLYAHGFSLAEFLIRQRGPHYFVSFIEACLLQDQTWDALVYEYYGYSTLENLQNDWVAWIKEGTPDFIGTNMQAGNGHPGRKFLTKGAEENPVHEELPETLDVVPQSKARPEPNLVMWNTTHVNSTQKN